MTYKQLINALMDSQPRRTPGGRIIYNDEINRSIPRPIYYQLCERMRTIAAAASMGGHYVTGLHGRDLILARIIQRHLVEFTNYLPRMEW